MLKVEDIHTYYGASHILQGISLAIEPGEVVAVIGRNGVGKTTLVRSIVGLTPPRRGRVIFKDTDITRMPSHRIAQRGVGLVPQGRRIFASLSVREHLQVTARSRGIGRWTLERMTALFPNLAARLGQTANKLSGGEQQMLAAGRALVGNPDLLLMDEPTEGLAPAHGARTRPAGGKPQGGRHLDPSDRAAARLRAAPRRPHLHSQQGPDRASLPSGRVGRRSRDEIAVSGSVGRHLKSA